MDEFITLKEVLGEMDSGRKFNMSFITYDKRNEIGGELIDVDEAHKHNWIDPAEFKKQNAIQPRSKKPVRDPRHYENSTRNIILKNSECRKVHIRLIRKFNGKRVL